MKYYKIVAAIVKGMEKSTLEMETETGRERNTL